MEKMLSKQSGRAVLIKTPGRGRQRQIMDLVMRNIHIAVSGGVEPAIEEMKKQLRLDTMPHIIECFDISNHGCRLCEWVQCLGLLMGDQTNLDIENL